MNELGIYVHIPFCMQKCYYCDFVSFANKENRMEEYINALKKEIGYKKEELKERIINTIYIGGGTPSYLNKEYVIDIVNCIKENYNITDDCEITIEVNPGTVTEEKLIAYKNVGINRISIGLQSTNNKLLREIGRIHTYEQFLEVYKLARKIGFNNINVDLMLALPNQTIKDIKKSIKEITKLDPEHISIYSLILEENTKLEQLINEGELELVDENLERKMYWTVKNMLEENNYIHYEISNFSKKGYESKHNVNCWNQEEYIGFGLASHSYVNKKRFSNVYNLENYINNIEENKFEKNVIIEEEQDKEAQMKEYMMLGLRKISGISIQKFKNKFIENPIFIYYKELEKLTKEDLIEIDDDKIKLTEKGLDLANIVWQEFV